MVVDVLEESRGRPNDLALISPEEAWTYSALSKAVGQRSRALEGDGVGCGDSVPLNLEPDAAGVVELLAVWRRGAVAVPLNPSLTGREMALARNRIIGASLPERTQVVLWTSGTSGNPRGVALSFDNLAASARGATGRLTLGADDVWLASLSPAHVGGLALVVRSILLGGALVVTGPFRDRVVSDLIDGVGLPDDVDVRLTHMSLVPTQLIRLLDRRQGRPPPASFRCALIGGAHAPAGLVERALHEGWPLALTYGTTEMSSQIATAEPATTRRKPGTVGAPMPGVEIRIDDDGEISACGPTVALGYIGEGVGSITDGEGWYRTGDLGHIDDDGDLWITGRRIDRIVSGGVTIDAVEVEEALRSHPTVLDACVVGVPDEEWGEKVGVWIEPVVGEFDVEEVEADLRDRLSGPKLPRIWYVHGALPRNPNGKVDRVRVRAALESR